MSERPAFPGQALAAAGLNRQFVFDLAGLPEAVRASLGDTAGFQQLILLAHGGRRLWECVQASGCAGEHPIDDYTVRTVEAWLAEHLPGRDWRIVYPGEQPVGLQALGQLAGWHHASPFMIGIDAEWGSWYAYRAAVLIDFQFQPFFPVDRSNPCRSCVVRPCIAACPAGALDDGQFNLEACSRHRLQAGSGCALSCLARNACPVGSEHRYDTAQIAHSYGHSLAMLQRYRDQADAF